MQRASIVFEEVVAIIPTTSSNLERASTMIKNISPKNSPEKSIWISFHGAVLNPWMMELRELTLSLDIARKPLPDL